MVLPCVLSLIKYLLNRWPRGQCLHPSIEVGSLFLRVEILRLEIREHGVPRHKRKIRICALSANQVSIAIFLQNRVKNLSDAYGFVLVTLNRARKFLGVKHHEPCTLTKVGTLAR